MSWYLGVWKKYAVFSGRARRMEYWYFYLFNMIAGFVLAFMDGMLGLSNSDTGNGPLYSLYALAVVIPSIAVGVRRMHDTDHSGWWIIVPIVNLIFALTPGTNGANRFGEDPMAASYAPAFAPTVAAAPAGWMTDPMGRHQYRYWDGLKWTTSVSDNGVTSVDSL